MKRHQLIALLGGATIAWPRITLAQRATALRKVGVLESVAKASASGRVAGLKQRLKALGWSEGQNVQFDVRYASGEENRFSNLAAELISASPDVIVASTPPAVLALKQRTESIPLVFVVVSDPVSQGFVASLARPGGNITGFTNFDSAVAAKWLQMLKEIAPGITRIAVALNLQIPNAPRFSSWVEVAARASRMEVIEFPLQSVDDIKRIAGLDSRPGTGLITLPSPFAYTHRAEIIRLTALHHLPTINGMPDFASAGGLISYAPDIVGEYRQAASYVDRILRGAKPADLPVQNPIKYDLAINLKTAKALGLTVPQSLLIQADQVIR